MVFDDIQEMKTDVLVVGSGGAGMMAAIEARKYGLSVLMIDKVVLATNNNTRYSGGGLKAALPAHWVVSRLSATDPLPRTSHGKIDRAALCTRALSAPGPDSDPDPDQRT